jgi:hypothetical protein
MTSAGGTVTGVRVLAGVAATVMTTAAAIGIAPPANAAYGIEMNGTYSAVSNGDWATTSEVFIPENTVRATWTVSTTCTSPWDCTGQVTSDQGWTAPLKFSVDRWILKHDIPNWAPCPQGPPATGHQQMIFWGLNPPDSMVDPTNTSEMAGWDETNTDSGSCGVNKPLFIRLPLRLTRL